MKICGIYYIKNVINNKIYIGSSNNISHRIGMHKSLLRRGKHHSVRLQNSFNKHGEKAFEFEILDECEESNLWDMEYYWMNLTSSLNSQFGYNIIPPITFGRDKGSIKKRTLKDKKSKKVYQYTKEGELVKIWDSMGEVERDFGVYRTAVRDISLGNVKTAKGFIWLMEEHIESILKAVSSVKEGRDYSIVKSFQYDLSGNFIKEWESGVEVAKYFDKDGDYNNLYRRIDSNIPHHNYLFFSSFKGDIIKPYIKNKVVNPNAKKLKVEDMQEGKVYYFDGLREASRDLNLSRCYLKKCLKNRKIIKKRFKVIEI